MAVAKKATAAATKSKGSAKGKGQSKTKKPNKSDVAGKATLKPKPRPKPKAKTSKSKKSEPKKKPVVQRSLDDEEEELGSPEKESATESPMYDSDDGPPVEQDDTPTPPNKRKPWTKTELFIVGDKMNDVRNKKNARTHDSKTMNKWSECLKALKEDGYIRSYRGLRDKWTKMRTKYREMKEKSINDKGRKGINFQFLADYEDYFDHRDEAHDPLLVRQTEKQKGPDVYVAPPTVPPVAKSGVKRKLFSAPLLSTKRTKSKEAQDAQKGAGNNEMSTENLLSPLADDEEIFDEVGEEEQNLSPNTTTTATETVQERMLDNEEEMENVHLRRVVIDEESPNHISGLNNTGAELNNAPILPQFKLQTDSFRPGIVKGDLVLIKKSRITQNVRKKSEFGGHDFVPCIVNGIKKKNMVNLVTVEGENWPSVKKTAISAKITNPEILASVDYFQEPIRKGDWVFVRPGFERALGNKKQLKKFKTFEFEFLAGFRSSCVLGQRTAAGNLSNIVVVQSWEIGALRNKADVPEVPEVIPQLILSPFTLRNAPTTTAKAKDLQEKLDNGLGETGVENGYAVIYKDCLYFCIRDSVLQGFGPCLMDTDGNKKLLKNMKNWEQECDIIRPGDETALGRDGEDIEFGDMVKYFKLGNIQEIGLVMNVASDHLMLKRQSTGIAVMYDVAHESNCCQLTSNLERTMGQWQETYDATKIRNKAPILVKGNAGKSRRSQQQRNVDDEELESLVQQEKETGKPIGTSQKAQLFAKAFVKEIMPDLYDLASSSWKDKNASHTKLNSQTQMACTLQIQTSLYSMSEARRGVVARLQKTQNKMESMAEQKHKVYMCLAKALGNKMGVPIETGSNDVEEQIVKVDQTTQTESVRESRGEQNTNQTKETTSDVADGREETGFDLDMDDE